VTGKGIAMASAGFVLLLTAYLGPSEYRKAQMDAEVERLCAIDGGVKVYARAELPKEMFSSKGYSEIPLVIDARESKAAFVVENRSAPLKVGEKIGNWRPILFKNHLRVVRTSDNFVLGETIGYTRVGGDPVGPWPPSSKGGSCLREVVNLEPKIFTNWIER